MKIQLDTTNKTIKIEDAVQFSELIDTLERLLPGAWREYKLQASKTIVNWTNPIYINRYPLYEPYPWNNPYYVSCENTSNAIGSTNGTFNVEC